MSMLQTDMRDFALPKQKKNVVKYSRFVKKKWGSDADGHNKGTASGIPE